MVQIPKTSSRRRRFFGWFTRHKAMAVLAVLFAALLLYLVGSWAVLQVQIHFERERFMATSQKMNNVAAGLTDISGLRLIRTNYCNYTSPTAIFARGVRGCEVQADAVYVGVSRNSMVRISKEVYAKLLHQFPGIIENKGVYDETDLAVYNFTYEKLSCFYSSAYYNATIPQYLRDASVPPSGNVGLIEIDCGGRAKAEYFPVKN